MGRRARWPLAPSPTFSCANSRARMSWVRKRFTGVGMSWLSPRVTTWAFKASISVRRPFSTSWSIDERLAAVAVQTSLRRVSGSTRSSMPLARATARVSAAAATASSQAGGISGKAPFLTRNSAVRGLIPTFTRSFSQSTASMSPRTSQGKPAFRKRAATASTSPAETMEFAWRAHIGRAQAGQ